MVNNTQSPAFDIAAILGYAEGFINKVKNGEGLGLNEEQKKIFLKQMEDKVSQEAINELQNKMDQLKNIANKK